MPGCTGSGGGAAALYKNKRPGPHRARPAAWQCMPLVSGGGRPVSGYHGTGELAMRMRRAFACSALLAIGACIAVSVMASQSFRVRPPPEPGLEDWLDVWATYDLEAIPSRPESHVVQPGETLWSIAEMYRLPGDLRMTVDIIREINSLWGPEGPRLRPGQRLRVPENNVEQWPLAVKAAWRGR